jgi:hypothetical protein
MMSGGFGKLDQRETDRSSRAPRVIGLLLLLTELFRKNLGGRGI